MMKCCANCKFAKDIRNISPFTSNVYCKCKKEEVPEISQCEEHDFSNDNTGFSNRYIAFAL